MADNKGNVGFQTELSAKVIRGGKVVEKRYLTPVSLINRIRDLLHIRK